MSARDLLEVPAVPRPPRTPKRKAREYLAECFAALHATDDRFAGWWREARPNEKRVVCGLAGVHAGFAAVEWSKLPEIDRTAIKRASVDLHRQLSRLMEWMPERDRVRAAA
jgi:hypothetical protein